MVWPDFEIRNPHIKSDNLAKRDFLGLFFDLTCVQDLCVTIIWKPHREKQQCILKESPNSGFNVRVKFHRLTGVQSDRECSKLVDPLLQRRETFLMIIVHHGFKSRKKCSPIILQTFMKQARKEQKVRLNSTLNYEDQISYRRKSFLPPEHSGQPFVVIFSCLSIFSCPSIDTLINDHSFKLNTFEIAGLPNSNYDLRI